MNPMKALPYAAGGLVGGSILKSAFGKDKKKAVAPVPAAMVTSGIPGPSPSAPSYGF